MEQRFEILDPYRPLSDIILPQSYQHQIKETQERKQKIIELNHGEKVSYILHNYILKHDESFDSEVYKIVSRNDIPHQKMIGIVVSLC